MGAPQIILIAISALSFGITMSEHGKPRTGNESVWTSLIANIITFSLLWWGGFFHG